MTGSYSFSLDPAQLPPNNPNYGQGYEDLGSYDIVIGEGANTVTFEGGNDPYGAYSLYEAASDFYDNGSFSIVGQGVSFAPEPAVLPLLGFALPLLGLAIFAGPRVSRRFLVVDLPYLHTAQL